MTNRSYYHQTNALTALSVLHEAIDGAFADAPATEDAVVKATVARQQTSTVQTTFRTRYDYNASITIATVATTTTKTAFSHNKRLDLAAKLATQELNSVERV